MTSYTTSRACVWFMTTYRPIYQSVDSNYYINTLWGKQIQIRNVDSIYTVSIFIVNMYQQCAVRLFSHILKPLSCPLIFKILSLVISILQNSPWRVLMCVIYLADILLKSGLERARTRLLGLVFACRINPQFTFCILNSMFCLSVCNLSVSHLAKAAFSQDL